MNQEKNNPTLVSIPGQQLFPAVEDILEDGTQFKLVVTGNSMRPFLKHKRDSVTLTSITNHTIKRGDIVLIRRHSDTYVLHRVQKLQSDGFIMNGDAQTWDEFVPFIQVIAIVSRIERKGRLISCDNRTYRILSEVWMLLRPVRGLLFRSVGLLLRIYRKVTSGLKH